MDKHNCLLACLMYRTIQIAQQVARDLRDPILTQQAVHRVIITEAIKRLDKTITVCCSE
jgi:hypothetical protein